MLGPWLLAAVLAAAAVPRDDVRVDRVALATEVERQHPFPQIVYVVEGVVRWTQAGERFTAPAGTVVLVPEHTVHVMSPVGEAVIARFRWAPGGDLATLHGQSTMTEPVATRPAAAATGVRRYESGVGLNPGPHAHIDDVEWTTNFTYSEDLWKVYRYKPLVREPLRDWRGVARAEVRMGLQELDPGAAYPTHHHPSPEVYLVLSGSARWSVGDESFVAEPGRVIYTPPDTEHRIENRGSTPLRWLYFWWAPSGDVSVFRER